MLLHNISCISCVIQYVLTINSHSVACTSFPGGSDGKESSCNEGNVGSVPELGRSPG